MTKNRIADAVIFTGFILSVFFSGCSNDVNNTFQQDKPPTNVIPHVLVSNLNFPWGIEFVSNTDPDGVANGSVVTQGNLLIANRGTHGEFADTVTQIYPGNGHVEIYSHPGLTDYDGVPAVSGPYDVAFLGPFVWIANDAQGLGTVAATDPNPSKEPSGHTGQAGEPVPGPAGSGVFGVDDYGFVVTSVTPRNKAENVSHHPVIAVEFSAPVDPSTITSSTFQVRVDYSPISPNPPHPTGSYAFSDDYKRVEFVYGDDLAEYTRYRIVIDEKVTSRDGVPLNGDLGSPGPDDFISYFTVGYGNPRVIWVRPENGAAHVPINTMVEIGFSEPVRASTVTSTAFVVSDLDGSKVSGDIFVNESQTMATFIPRSTLDDDTTFMVEVNYRVRDLAGNPLDQVPGGYPDPFISYFSTGDLSVQPPRVHTAEITDDVLAILFTKEIDPASRTGSYLSVSDPDQQYVPGTINWPSNSHLSFVATNGFAEGYYDVCIEDVLTDMEGLHLDGDADGNPGGRFCAQIPSGADRLFVTSSYPEDGDINISIDTQMFINFSKQVNPSTITNSSVFVAPAQDPGNRLPASINLNPGNISLTMKTTADLSEDTDYVLTVTTDVTDLAGNSLDQEPGLPLDPFMVIFRTGSAYSTTAKVYDICPAPGETGVSLHTGIVVRFTEPIDPGTVTSASFRVTGSAGEVPGKFSFKSGNAILAFHPDEKLFSEERYSITLSPDIKTPGGHSIDTDDTQHYRRSFTFTTKRGTVVINELVLHPQQNWNDQETGDRIPFNAIPGTGTVTGADRWIELFNASDQILDLTGWVLNMTDSGAEPYVIGSGKAAELINPPTAGISNFLPAAYLVIGNPPGLCDSVNTISLHDAFGALVDRVETGKIHAGAVASDTGTADFIKALTGCPANEALARVPNGASSGDTSTDFVRQPATIGYDNGGPYGFGICEGFWGADVGLVGVSGITAAGIAPDEPGYMSHLVFATHTDLGVVFGIDLDNGPYVAVSGLNKPMGIEYVPILDNNDIIPGKGYLFVTDPESGNIARIRMTPSGPVGHPFTRSVVDTGTQNSLVFFSYPILKNPVGIAYSQERDTVFIACRENGIVLEITLDGALKNTFDTGLGTNALGGIDIGDMGKGDLVFITHTGGDRIHPGDGNRGSVLYFSPES
jgi:hypothetical protein